MTAAVAGGGEWAVAEADAARFGQMFADACAALAPPQPPRSARLTKAPQP